MLRDGVKTRPEFTTLKAAFEKRFPDDSVAVADQRPEHDHDSMVQRGAAAS
jgi:hypothetical protein